MSGNHTGKVLNGDTAAPVSQPPDYSKISLTHPDLGEYVFEGFEVPEDIPLGGEQQVVVNKYIGTNKRQLQVLGAQPTPLTWHGQFMFENALARAQYVDRMRELGKVLKFVWGEYKFDAVIEKFEYKPKNQFLIPYDITLQIATLEDNSKKSFSLKPSGFEASFLLQLMEKILTGITTLRRVLAIVTVVQKGDINSLIGAASNVFSILGSVNGQLGSLGNSQLTSLASSANLMLLTSRSLILTVADTDFSKLPLSEVFGMQSSAKTLQETIKKFSQASRSNAVTVVRTNLFELAQKHYGTTDAWEVIAKENNLTGARVLGPQKIKLPPYKGAQPVFDGDQTAYEVRKRSVPAFK